MARKRYRDIIEVTDGCVAWINRASGGRFCVFSRNDRGTTSSKHLASDDSRLLRFDVLLTDPRSGTSEWRERVRATCREVVLGSDP